MLIVARPAEAALAQAERYFTRKLHPVFNSRNVGDTALAMVHSVQPMVADDIVTVASRTLRKKEKNNPRLKPSQWASLVAELASIGE